MINYDLKCHVQNVPVIPISNPSNGLGQISISIITEFEIENIKYLKGETLKKERTNQIPRGYQYLFEKLKTWMKIFGVEIENNRNNTKTYNIFQSSD